MSNEPAASVPPAAAVPVEVLSGADLLGSMPDVNPRAVAASAPSPAPVPAVPAADAAEVKDAFGVVFRRGFHREKPDGSPFLGSRGQFMPRGGRKKAVPAQASFPDFGSSVPDRFPGTPPPSPAPDAQPAPEKPAQPAGAVPAPESAPMSSEAHELAAETVLRASYHVADELLAKGKGEWQPDADSEHTGLKSVVVSLSKEYGRPLPGWLLAGLTVAVFVLKRIRRPETQKTLVKVSPETVAEAGPAKRAEVTLVPARPSASNNLGDY